jgi:hypothetical protein
MVGRPWTGTSADTVRAVHPLLPILIDAAHGRFPEADGATEVFAPDADGTVAVVGFTGHAFVLASVDPAEIAARQEDDAGGGFGGVFAPTLLSWLAGSWGVVGSTDVVLAARGRGGGSADVRELAIDDPVRAHPRVRRAEQHRAGVRVFGDDAGLAIVGTGLAGRTELSVELFDPSRVAAGRGRALIAAGLTHVDPDDWCFAQVAAGNARSLRSFLAAGFVPIGSEVLITARGER